MATVDGCNGRAAGLGMPSTLVSTAWIVTANGPLAGFRTLTLLAAAEGRPAPA